MKRLVILIICLVLMGCSHMESTPCPKLNLDIQTWELPQRPEMLPVQFKDTGQHCLDNENAKNYLKNINRLQNQIRLLETQIIEMNLYLQNLEKVIEQ
jgi:TolA-binding protein